MTLSQLQKEQAEWSARNFGAHPELHPMLGMIEEIGELSHAHLKALQGIRGTPEEHRAEKIDAVADWFIYLADWCTCVGKTLEGQWELSRERVFIDLEMYSESGLLIPLAARETVKGNAYIAIAYMFAYCQMEGIDALEAIFSTWEQVKQRNWKADPLCATTLE